jgi:hypothetical protein
LKEEAGQTEFIAKEEQVMHLFRHENQTGALQRRHKSLERFKASL